MERKQTPYRRSFRKGAIRASTLLERDIRRIGESRGFAASKVLTHWAEIVGPEIAGIARPVNVSFSKGGMGGTLTVLTTGSQAPMLEMQKERLRERVNATYGYQAIRRIHITQTAPTGFGADAAPEAQAKPAPAPEARAAARSETGDVADPDLRAALERLGSHVLSSKS